MMTLKKIMNRLIWTSLC